MSSVNSGFATKQLESTYNTLVYNLLYLLQYRLKKLYTSETVSETNFKHVMMRVVRKCAKLEQTKFAYPKFSEAISDLCEVLSAQKSADGTTCGGADLAGMSDSAVTPDLIETCVGGRPLSNGRITPEVLQMASQKQRPKLKSSQCGRKNKQSLLAV